MLVYQIISVILSIQSLILIIISSVATVRYINRKNKVALYYALSNITFLATSTASNIGIIDLIQNSGEKTMLYFGSILAMNIGIIFASMFLYLFFCEINNIPKKLRIMNIIVAFGIVFLELLPFNGWFDVNAEGFQLKYISQLVQTIYCCTIFITLAKGFFYLAKRVNEEHTGFELMAWGNILLALFFVTMFCRAFAGESNFLPIIQIGSWAIILTAIISLFIGFITPTLKEAKKKGEL